MSDTPLTDAKMNHPWSKVPDKDDRYLMMCQHARDLERRLSAVEAERDEAIKRADRVQELHVGVLEDQDKRYLQTWAALTAAQERIGVLTKALLDIEAHHYQTNINKGRDPARSHTLALVRAALATPTAPPCDPTMTECPRCKNDIFKCDGVFAPTAPQGDPPRSGFALNRIASALVAQEKPRNDAYTQMERTGCWPEKPTEGGDNHGCK